jgi:hypothetical protein
VPRGPKGKRVVAGDGYSVAGKNSNGVGSVYFEPPSTRADGTVVRGRWRATYVDLDGKIKRVSGPTRALAESRRDELVAALGRRRSPTTSRFSITTTIQELSDWWLESVARHQVRESSLATYRKSVAYLADELGHVRVIDVGPEVLTVWQSALLDRLAPYTVLSCRKACRQIFAEAVKMGLIATNPFDLVHAPRAVGVKEGRALSAADARKLVTAAAPIRLGVAVTLLFCQGWRVSEVLGLAWDDLDLEAGTAHIRRAATHSAASGVTFGPTKTSGAQGLHHLAPIAVVQLRAPSCAAGGRAIGGRLGMARAHLPGQADLAGVHQHDGWARQSAGDHQGHPAHGPTCRARPSGPGDTRRETNRHHRAVRRGWARPDRCRSPRWSLQPVHDRRLREVPGATPRSHRTSRRRTSGSDHGRQVTGLVLTTLGGGRESATRVGSAVRWERTTSIVGSQCTRHRRCRRSGKRARAQPCVP